MTTNNSSLKFSVSVVTYNQEDYISQALDSILSQEHNYPYEIIVSDDCSTDSTPQIILDYQKKYPEIIKPILHPKNLGFGKNSILNIRSCKGEYIALLDGDDYWTDNLKIKKQISFLDEHPEYTLSCHRFRRYLQDTGTYKEDFAPELFTDEIDGFEFDESVFFNKWLTQTMTVVFRRRCIDNRPELDTYRYFRDTPLFWTLISQGKGYVHNFDGAIYRVHNSGVWSKVSLLAKEIQMAHMLEELLHVHLHNINIKQILHFAYYNILKELPIPKNWFLNDEHIENKDFTIISDDNWGKEVYKAYRLPFATPFIGVRLFNLDFAILTTDFENLMSLTPEFISLEQSKHVTEYSISYGNPYPIAKLGDDVELHFVDYNSEEEALELWQERVELINWDNLIFKMDASREHHPEEGVKLFYSEKNAAKNKLCFYDTYHTLNIDDKDILSQIIGTEFWVPDEESFFLLTLGFIDYNALLNHRFSDLQGQKKPNKVITSKHRNYFLQEFDEVTTNSFFNNFFNTYNFHYDTTKEAVVINYDKVGTDSIYLDANELVHNLNTSVKLDLSTPEDRNILFLVKGPVHHRLSIDLVVLDKDGKERTLGIERYERPLTNDYEWLHFDISGLAGEEMEDMLTRVKGFVLIVNPFDKARGQIEVLGVYAGSIEKMQELIE